MKFIKSVIVKLIVLLFITAIGAYGLSFVMPDVPHNKLFSTSFFLIIGSYLVIKLASKIIKLAIVVILAIVFVKLMG